MNLTTLWAAGAAAAVLCLGGLARAADAPGVTTHGPKAAADEIIAAEHGYSALFSSKGMAAGFSDFLDPKDGMAFEGGPKPLHAETLAKVLAADKGVLSWEPREVFASKGGDMGASWGRFQSATPEGKVVATGTYVTVWRKGEDGKWRALMDIGAPDAAAH